MDLNKSNRDPSSSTVGCPMHLKRRTIPLTLLIFLVSTAVIAITITFRHTIISDDDPLSFSVTHRTLPNRPFPSTFTFTIKLLTYDRLPSLRRCLQSLALADYDADDRVNLHVFVDHFRNDSDLVDSKLDESRQILEFLDRFRWEHGEKIVHYRTSNAGLQAQWLEAWWPISDDDFAFVVEDDLEVSRFYYRFLKVLIGKYYYGTSGGFNPSIYGASLQRPRFVPGKHGNKIQLDADEHLFLYQLVGTWGQLLFPKPWKEFRLWYDIHKFKGIKPILQGMVTNGWYKKLGEKIWTPWFIKFIHSRGYYNIYMNFQDERALSVSHRDAGVNYGKSAGPDSSLLDEKSLDFNIWELQPLRKLKWYDFCFRQVFPGRIVRSFSGLQSVLHTFQKQKTVLLFSLYRTSESITKNFLCHLERLNIQNYIFIDNDSGFLLDLARRGHPIIDGSEFINSITNDNISGFGDSDVDLIKELLVKAYTIKKCMELGYNTWMIDGNMIPINDSFSQLSETSYDFLTEKNAELLFTRYSQSSVNIWSDKFIYKMLSAAKSLNIHSDQKPSLKFVQLVTNALLEKNSGGRVSNVLSKFGIRLGVAFANEMHMKKMVFWHPEMGLNTVQTELGNAGLWLIDSDSSCASVVCHQS